jgi:transposase
MPDTASVLPNVTIGLDLGDRTSRLYEIDTTGERVAEGAVPTTPRGLTRHFTGRARCRVVLEVGTHSPWVSRLLAELGHEVVVANPSATYGARRPRKRNDRLDAEFLARQGRADVQLLHPIQHRGFVAQQDLALLRARDQVVQTRSKLINHVRGAVKAHGARLPACSAEAFATRAALTVPPALASALAPLLEIIADLSRRIAAYDRQIAQLLRTRYPIARRLQQPAGVGPLTALAFVLLVEEPTRFRRSRDVGAYFGLVPRLDESSRAQPQLRISKAGDTMGRRLLVSAAQYILGPFGPACDLRRHGEAIAQRGGKNAKKRAAVAVARKLAVLLHRLWISGRDYDPDYLLHRRPA